VKVVRHAARLADSTRCSASIGALAEKQARKPQG
jgi:hypothetical protein